MKYTSENFHLHYIPQYRLLIKSDFLEDTLLVLDDSNEVQALYSYPCDTPDPEAVKLLGLPFQHVAISLPLQSLAFVPSEVYSSRDLGHYQDFLLDEQQGRTHTFQVEKYGITAVYQYDLLLQNRWAAILPEAKLLNDSQVVLQSIEAYIPSQGTILGIHVKDKQMELFVFIDGSFQLYNLFDIDNSEDLQYFVLNVCKTLELAPKFDKIILSGVGASHPYTRVAEKYSPVIEFLRSSTKISSGSATVQEEIESSNLLADYLECVS